MNSFEATLNKEGMRAVAKYLQAILKEVQDLRTEVAEIKRRSSNVSGGITVTANGSGGATKKEEPKE